MTYFDKANNEVTRKSFGSKVDKEFKREGVIPIKDRKKNTFDPVAESAKQKELDKKVNERRVNEMKEAREFENKLQEGYVELKNELIKDFIGEICVESLVIDEEAVNTNLKNILEMVEHQIDDLGGFEGIKRIAESTNNPILLRMVSVCEATAKDVGQRNIRESQGKASGINFTLNQVELDEYDYRKKAMGSETIVNVIKDKVFQVVKDEQKLNADKQMIMDDIQNKVSELNAPVEEAMSFIFESAGIEEDTLFNSLMRCHYKQLMETNSSAIFESFDYKSEAEPVFEESDFDMSDIELVDDEDDIDIEDMFLDEAAKVEGMELEEALETLYQNLYNSSQGVQSRSEALKYKTLIRRVQESFENDEYIEEGLIKKIKEKIMKLKNPAKMNCEELERNIEDIQKNCERLLADESINNNYDQMIKIATSLEDERFRVMKLVDKIHAGKEENGEEKIEILGRYHKWLDQMEVKITKDAKKLNEGYNLSRADELHNRLLSFLQESSDDMMSEPVHEIEKAADKLSDPKKAAQSGAKKTTEEVILCPKCGKEGPCNCKVAKESLTFNGDEDEILTEGVKDILHDIKRMFSAEGRQQLKDKKEFKKSIEDSKKSIEKAYKECTSKEDYEGVVKVCAYVLKMYSELAGRDDNQDRVKAVEGYKKWLKKMITKAGKHLADEVEIQIEGFVFNTNYEDKLLEEYDNKLEDICEKMNYIIEAHEYAKNNVVESLRYDRTIVPYLQMKDIDLSNLEFAYKAKMVCESLKNTLHKVEYLQEAHVIEKAVELNVQSINETLSCIENRSTMAYKTKILNMSKKYLEKIQEAINKSNFEYNDEVLESASLFNTPEDVERIFNKVKEYYVLESVDIEVMELVMSEAIVEYTIMETMNTLNLIKYTKDDVRRMARKNISYVSEGLFGFGKKGKKNKGLPHYEGKYGEPVDDESKYLQLYDSCMKKLVSVIEKAFPGCEIHDDVKADKRKVTEYDNANVIQIYKCVINLQKNFDIVKSKSEIFNDANSIDDVDGEEMYDFLKKYIFNKMSEFKETEGTYGMFYHKTYEELCIFCDEDFERISIDINLPCKK